MKSKIQLEDEIKKTENKLIKLKAELTQAISINVLYGPNNNLQEGWILGRANEHYSYTLMVPSSSKSREKGFESFSGVNLGYDAAINIINALQSWIHNYHPIAN